MKGLKKWQLILNIFLLSLFIISIAFLTIKYAPGITKLISNPNKFRNLLISYGSTSVLVFIFFQIVQVIIAAIPGELIQLAGGYVYGTLFGTLYSIIGIVLGSIISFYIARLLGFRLIKAFVSETDLAKFNFLINSPKSEIILFLLFLIPGIPKDILIYIAGFTPLKPAKFFIIFSIARFPGLLGSSFIGSNIHEKDFVSVIIVSTIACVLFVFGLLKKDQIVHKLHQILSPKKEF